jgi:mannose/fructose/N-acetylgalactosamine-specific phosphotransferase system component IIC
MLIALILAIWAYFCIYDMLSPFFIGGFRPLIAGFGTGIIVGDVQTGMLIGGTLELMALGVYTYGGATIPDFTVGAILGTYFGKTEGFEVGISLAIPAALLLTQVDILNRFLNFIFVHRADAYAEESNVKGFERMMVWFSHMIWGFSRFIPVFLAVAFGEAAVKAVSSFFEANPWFNRGISVTGGILPALGFAMLLKILPIEQFPAFLLLGFIFYAYLKVPLVGIALAAVAVALVYQQLKYRGQEA